MSSPNIVYQMHAGCSKPVKVEVVLDGKPLTMELHRSSGITGIGEYVPGILSWPAAAGV